MLPTTIVSFMYNSWHTSFNSMLEIASAPSAPQILFYSLFCTGMKLPESH